MSNKLERDVLMETLEVELNKLYVNYKLRYLITPIESLTFKEMFKQRYPTLSRFIYEIKGEENVQ